MFIMPDGSYRDDYVFLTQENLPEIALFSCGGLVNTAAKTGFTWRTASSPSPDGGSIQFDMGKGRIVRVNVSAMLRKYFYNELLRYSQDRVRSLAFIDASQYSITDDGKLWSWKEYRFLNPTPDNRGYPRTALLLDVAQSRKMFRIHRLVAMAFIPNPNGYAEVNHKDGVKTNNHVTNLEWVTHQQNREHGVKTGLFRTRKPRFVATEEQAHAACRLLESGMTIRQVAVELDVPYEAVRRLRVNQHAHIFEQYDIQIGNPGRPKCDSQDEDMVYTVWKHAEE